MKPVVQKQACGKAKKTLRSGIMLDDLSGLKAVRLATWFYQDCQKGLFYLPGAQLWGIGLTEASRPSQIKLYQAPQLLKELTRSYGKPDTVRIFQSGFQDDLRIFKYGLTKPHEVSSLLEALSRINLLDLYALPLPVRRALVTQRIVNELER